MHIQKYVPYVLVINVFLSQHQQLFMFNTKVFFKGVQTLRLGQFKFPALQRVGFLLVSTSLLVGCQVKPNANQSLTTQLDGPLAQLQVDTRQVHSHLLRLTQDKRCEVAADCKVLAIGHRSCGGPEQYLVYSKRYVDENLLKITNDRYSDLKKEQQVRIGMFSTCQILPEPSVTCQRNQCVTTVEE